MNACHYILEICLTRTPADSGIAIFGFAEFLAALALLVLVFSSSDFLYQFRISVAPIPLRGLSFAATVLVGVGSLLTDLWFAERWYSLSWGISRATLQGIFGALFLSTVLLWIWFAFARPPIFSRWNYKRFYGALFRTIVRGSGTQLAVVAAELLRSAESLVRLSGDRRFGRATGNRPAVAECAHDVLLLLSNAKLCRHVVESSPVTAIALMQEAAKQNRHHIPLGGFIKSVTQEALINQDSILYHENSYDDVLGLVQPFSKTLYGNYPLMCGIAGPMESILDVDFRIAWELDGPQFEAYCRITLLAFKSCVETGHYKRNSPFSREFELIGRAGMELHTLHGQPTGSIDRTSEKRFAAAVRFVADLIEFLGEQKDLDLGPLRPPKNDGLRYYPTIFDDIANLMFELLLSASSVRSPSETAWWIQYNAFWGRIVPFGENSGVRKVIFYKFNRLVFDSIKELERFPNFQSSRVLGLCLNVFGLGTYNRSEGRRVDYALSKAVLGWTKRNYLRLCKVHPPVAEDCLSADITFEPEHSRLVKTFAQGLRLEPSRSYLDLDPPPPDDEMEKPSRASLLASLRSKLPRRNPSRDKA